MQAGQYKGIGTAKQFCETAQMLRFSQIIGFGMQLALCLVQQGREVHRAGQQARQAEQGGHIVHIAVDAVPHAGILHLDCKILPVACNRAVNLPDRSRCKGAHIEPGKAAVPARPPFGVQNGLQLFWRHVLRIIAHARQNCRQLLWQDDPGIHRQHLPQL